MLKDLSRQRQVDVLCTTHNPVLLDELGSKMIPFISDVTRDEHGDSHAIPSEKENCQIDGFLNNRQNDG